MRKLNLRFAISQKARLFPLYNLLESDSQVARPFSDNLPLHSCIAWMRAHTLSPARCGHWGAAPHERDRRSTSLGTSCPRIPEYGRMLADRRKPPDSVASGGALPRPDHAKPIGRVP